MASAASLNAGLLIGAEHVLIGPERLALPAAGVQIEHWASQLQKLGISALPSSLACLQHFALRVLLWRAADIPWDYTRFLDYCVERILLRKVGGGYIFVHRLLLEHFTGVTDGTVAADMSRADVETRDRHAER
jgi:hypothetical protein